MKSILLLNQSLNSVFWADQSHRIIRNILLVIIGSIAIAIAAQIIIPLQPVPVTLQTLVVLFLGMTYGWRLACCTIVAYLLEGVMGLPVFAGMKAGPAIFSSPTAGYLLAWLPAVTVVGWLTEHGWGKHPLTVFLAGMIGNIIIYCGGMALLTHFLALRVAFTVGVTPFLLGDVLKITFIAFVVPVFWRK